MREVGVFSQSANHLQSDTLLLGAQACWQSQMFRSLQKVRSVCADFTCRVAIMFQRIGAMAEKALLLNLNH